MKIVLAMLVALALLTGCASKPTIQPVERARLELPNPQPLNLRPIQWSVVTIDGVAYFGLTAEGYEALSLNTLDTTNFIGAQFNVINQYRKYYEHPTLGVR